MLLLRHFDCRPIIFLGYLSPLSRRVFLWVLWLLLANVGSRFAFRVPGAVPEGDHSSLRTRESVLGTPQSLSLA